MTDTSNKKSPSPIVPIIVAAAVIIVILVVVGQRQNYKPIVKGSAAIDFTLPDLNGRLQHLGDHQGKVVFLNFWATWCKPCEEEIPSMERLYKSLKGRNFEILALSTDKDAPEVVKEFTDNYGVTFTVLHDRRGKIKEAYKTTGFPETFIIDQNGMVAEKIVGPRDWDNPANIRTIKALLDNPPAPLKTSNAVVLTGSGK